MEKMTGFLIDIVNRAAKITEQKFAVRAKEAEGISDLITDCCALARRLNHE